MIERVARAILRAEGLDADAVMPETRLYQLSIKQAKAAIAAMWTPFDPEDETTWPEGLVLCEIHDERDGNCYWLGEISKICGPSWWFHDRETTASIDVVSRYQEITKEQSDE